MGDAVEVLIVPAIIAKTQSELDGMLERIRGRVKRVQLDVMDGEFVPNTSLDFDFELPTGFEYEAHLMVRNSLEWVGENARKVDIVIMHVETIKDVAASVDYVAKKGVRVVLAITLETTLVAITQHLRHLDGVLAMTVEPGSYCVNKEFRPEPLEKIKKLRQSNKVIPIEVDGCINPKNARLAREAGANIFASGSYIFKSADLDKAVKKLEDAVTRRRARKLVNRV